MVNTGLNMPFDVVKTTLQKEHYSQRGIIATMAELTKQHSTVKV
jgi:hypothetical protein